MKGLHVMLLLLGMTMFCSNTLVGQTHNEGSTTKGTLDDDIDDGPMIFKFEPDYLLSVEERKLEILHYRAVIDTLAISDRKRRVLLKDLYKNGMSDRLSKALMAETKFEHVD